VTDERLVRWLDALLETRGLTAVNDPGKARRVHLDASLAAAPYVARYPGSIVDVGSGGGAPGIPLAATFPDREVTLLESNGRKCAFLERWTVCFPNLRVVHGRAEEQPVDEWGVAVAMALAPPPVALEWCLPLVAPGGAAVLLVGPTADVAVIVRAAELLAGGAPELHAGVIVVPKLGPTPARFPRRPGAARKRPLV
jgi:16S rRNA (guanine527-N7)-methyltransferase